MCVSCIIMCKQKEMGHALKKTDSSIQVGCWDAKVYKRRFYEKC